MAEAEDVITDAARHATVFVQGLWRRNRANTSAAREAPALALTDVAQRLDLLIVAVFGRACPLRTAQAPARATLLARCFQRQRHPGALGAIPATDGRSIWLPAATGLADAAKALERFRTVALQQAMRVVRGSAAGAGSDATPLVRGLYLLFEAHAADLALAQCLPGMEAPLNALRAAALSARPAMSRFTAGRQPLETWARRLMATTSGTRGTDAWRSASPDDSRQMARDVANALVRDFPMAGRLATQGLYKDWWTGELIAPSTTAAPAIGEDSATDLEPARPIRSARLARRPQVREAADDEDDARQGAWMIQASAPHEAAEDPFGLQRPTDRDAQTAADEFAESLAELEQARLVSTPGRPTEVLLSDDPPDTRKAPPRHANGTVARESEPIRYPEWDHRLQAYNEAGAIVRLLPAADGPQQWVDDTLAEHRSMLHAIQRRFEMLRGQRAPLRRQLDGDDVDLEACIEARADHHAGYPMAQALYRSQKRMKRDMAIMLLIDVSGSTDGWVSSGRRVIDVEREALLLVCIALGAMGEPYAVQAFSGHGPKSVSVRILKRFDEPYGNQVATRIAALEPEQYTRAGAAIRHASGTLMREPASQRLLLLLSDGKPNDVDVYEGRYGVEDMRRAVIEAKLQGIAPFCLTVDRHAAAYLPGVFGANQYAMLAKPSLLPTVLLDWMQRLVMAG